ncbi:hypothetical protein [Rhodococcus sp. AD45]|uniref:hypothetical protein n=1 Tax=Rhodococcus sp. (strain AD45) TaxID=103808 RepID=UPI0005D3F073|nr:hypothetical protein [Rhodococcus sp. AD45]KJF19413.1 hypothetical protein SZ00_06340 [Rhodococcus sp. AD45]
MTKAEHPKPRTIDDLLTAYDDWKGLLDRDTDDDGTIAMVTALYRFAIKNFNQSGTSLLMQALDAVEAAEKR